VFATILHIPSLRSINSMMELLKLSQLLCQRHSGCNTREKDMPTGTPQASHVRHKQI
jgi:hypothetical protein